MGRWTGLAAAAVLVGAVLAPARGAAEVLFGPAAVLNDNAAVDAGDDWNPVVATDGQGRWVAVWSSDDDLGGTIGTDRDILVSRSTDRGRTWTSPAPLNGNAAFDSGDDGSVALATDGWCHWLAAWQSNDTFGGTLGADRDLLAASSTDSGATWSWPTVVNSNAATDSDSDYLGDLATDGLGLWVAVWESEENLGGTIGDDSDVLLARSTDNGATWSPVAVLNANAAGDLDDYDPTVRGDGAGQWVAVWHTRTDIGGNVGTDFDVAFARSSDGGATWGAPAILNDYAAGDAAADMVARVATDGYGTFLATWHSLHDLGGSTGGDNEVFLARSTDHGGTWSPTTVLNANAAVDAGDDFFARTVSDGRGLWLAAWESTDSLGGTVGTDYDLLFATSADGGATWSWPALLNNTGAGDEREDTSVALASDASTTWVVVWESTSYVGDQYGTDDDLFTAANVDLFADGFESGGVAAWSSTVP